MSCCGFGGNGEDGGRNRDIDNFLNKNRRDEQSKVKLLLLGAGESGKSTIFKQMRILYGTPPTDEEREYFTSVVYDNVMTNIQVVINQAESWNMKQEIGDQGAVDLILNAELPCKIDTSLGTAIKTVWNDPVIQKVWERRNEFQVIESMAYFFDDMDKVMADDYLATQQDFLYTRVRTSGVVTTSYDIQSVIFEMYDVGGQRNERRKWIHCFSDVTAVIFVAALSEYDQVLFEDSHTNRMQEALELFGEICSLNYFEKSAIILFLNKYDLFEQKFHDHPINKVGLWSDYSGGDNIEEGLKYFSDKFSAKGAEHNRSVYLRTTTATDTKNVEFVFKACRDSILERNIDDSGF